MSDQLKLVFLGTGAAVPTLRRAPPALAIVRNGEIILCDCGEGTQMRINSARLSPTRIGTICISHLHGDHVFGLPGFLTTQQMLGREVPLTLYGPPGLAGFLQGIRSATGFRIDYPEAVPVAIQVLQRFSANFQAFVHKQIAGDLLWIRTLHKRIITGISQEILFL